eukprot:TRINITY_DN36018_c0_g1_i1.p1 TRINITY_DN36018_c0_g1~~TRINITY_DN36018_c0_g1_i1.p1  ORF type:complete len:650 (+),score=107.58 TRINITY_DN36018_c0_g1_i1:50-1999(+)
MARESHVRRGQTMAAQKPVGRGQARVHPQMGGRNSAGLGRADTNPSQRRPSRGEDGEEGFGGGRVESWADLGEAEFTEEALAAPTEAVLEVDAATRAARQRRRKRRDVQPQGRSGPSNGMWHQELGQRWAAPDMPVLRKRKATARMDLKDELDATFGRQDVVAPFEVDEESLDSAHAQWRRPKLPIQCRYFYNGTCRNGPECTYLHGADEAEANGHGGRASARPQCCLNWLYSHCPNGERCSLPHRLPDAWSIAAPTAAALQRSGARSEQVCGHWLRGSCRLGSECPNKHPTPETAAAPAAVAEQVSITLNAAVAVLAPIRALREEVLILRSRLALGDENLLTRVFQMVLGGMDDQPRETLLGLTGDTVGLTRFRSVLLKRTLKWAFDAGNLDAIECLVRWERKLLADGWLTTPPANGEFSRYFEANLCQHHLECLKLMAASPYARGRGPLVPGGDEGLNVSDPAASVLRLWASAPPPAVVRVCEAGDWQESHSWRQWSAEDHRMWPAPFRGRARCLAKVLSRHPPMLRSALPGVLSFLPPVCATDVPREDREPGEHPFLDMVGAVLANQTLDIIGADQDSSDTGQRLGEAIWPLVVASCGEDAAPKMTGMLLQMPPEALLLDAVNVMHFNETLAEAWDVLTSPDAYDD